MNNKEKNFVSAVIYVYNDEKRIKHFLDLIINVFQDNFEHSEIICVNDCSSDGSVEMIKEVSNKITLRTISVSVINLSYFHGLETAMNAGMDLAIGDFVFEFDSMILDFHGEEIMNVYNHSLKGFDIVSASPNEKQKFTSDLFYLVFEKYANLPYKMSTERFRILSRRVINRISNMTKTVPYRKPIYANCGLRADNLIYEVIPEEKSKKAIDKKERRYRSTLAIDSLILFTEMGYRFSIMMTSLLIIISVFMVAYSLTVYLLGNPVAGWTTTILFVSFCFFGLFGILTIIIKYLQILLNLVFKRKRYTFASIEKLTK